MPNAPRLHRKDGIFSLDDFRFDKDRDIYVCPTGKVLKNTGRVRTGQILRYRASTYDSGPCPLKSGLDCYRRVLALCAPLDGSDINAWMARHGWALVHYSQAYRFEQAKAHAARRGVRAAVHAAEGVAASTSHWRMR